MSGNSSGGSSFTPSIPPVYCTPVILPSLGQLVIGGTTLTLPSNVQFTPRCDATTFNKLFAASAPSIQDPFHETVVPQAYATGAATVLAYLLVLMLIITPRTFFVGGVGGGVGLLGHRGMISGSQGSNSVIGVGSRPWLQKIASLAVAVSLTIATIDTFRVAERQYNLGITNANDLRNEVTNSLQIKISKIVSDFFVWLAQVQTLIRIFPRHKEKVMIKWIGFCIIVIDFIFGCLDKFVVGESVTSPRKLSSAIPALNYVFQFALNTLYAGWVLFYVYCKRRYAFYHHLMWNISVVALLSIIALFTPIVFFITDLADSTIAAWGDYFRWVGGAAASGIVWEWVERIEALEREEKKDGILGVEVFDEDSSLGEYGGTAYNRQQGHDNNGGGALYLRRRRWRSKAKSEAKHPVGILEQPASPQQTSTVSPTALGTAAATIARPLPAAAIAASGRDRRSTGPVANRSAAVAPSPPRPQTKSPISRADTSSASTVYDVQYNTLNMPMPPISKDSENPRHGGNDTVDKELPALDTNNDSDGLPAAKASVLAWFRRRRDQPPAEVRQGHILQTTIASPGSGATADTSLNDQQPPQQQQLAKWDIKGRIAAFTAGQSESLRERQRRETQPHNDSEEGEDDDMPITIIPAQPRRTATHSFHPPLSTSQLSTLPEHSSEAPEPSSDR